MDELVKALHETADWIVALATESRFAHDELNALHHEDTVRKAADAIEKLIQIANHHEQSAKDWWKEARDWKQKATALSAEVERLKGEHNGNK